jgi:hypothetical protein
MIRRLVKGHEAAVSSPDDRPAATGRGRPCRPGSCRDT